MYKSNGLSAQVKHNIALILLSHFNFNFIQVYKKTTTTGHWLINLSIMYMFSFSWLSTFFNIIYNMCETQVIWIKLTFWYNFS